MDTEKYYSGSMPGVETDENGTPLDRSLWSTWALMRIANTMERLETTVSSLERLIEKQTPGTDAHAATGSWRAKKISLESARLKLKVKYGSKEVAPSMKTALKHCAKQKIDPSDLYEHLIPKLQQSLDESREKMKKSARKAGRKTRFQKKV